MSDFIASKAPALILVGVSVGILGHAVKLLVFLG